jgi:hypothetical protein
MELTMRAALLGFAAAFTCLTATGLRAQETFQLFVSLSDPSGTPVAMLTPTDLRVMEAGADARVMKVEPIDWPVKVQVLVDNGIGLGSENLIHARNGVRALFEALPANVEIAFYTTAPQPRAVVRATTDRTQVLQGVDRLAPDSGAGRFVESLNEATQRIERDKSNHFPVIISVASTAGDTNIMERDVERLMQRLQQRPTAVHVVVLSTIRSGTSGANQMQVGMAVTKMSGGRYESIAAPSRLATLLPEIGAQVARSHALQSAQFRLTVERPSGARGPIGEIGLAARAGLTVKVTRDGVMP